MEQGRAGQHRTGHDRVMTRIRSKAVLAPSPLPVPVPVPVPGRGGEGVLDGGWDAADYPTLPYFTLLYFTFWGGGRSAVWLAGWLAGWETMAHVRSTLLHCTVKYEGRALTGSCAQGMGVSDGRHLPRWGREMLLAACCASWMACEGGGKVVVERTGWRCDAILYVDTFKISVAWGSWHHPPPTTHHSPPAPTNDDDELN